MRLLSVFLEWISACLEKTEAFAALYCFFVINLCEETVKRC